MNEINKILPQEKLSTRQRVERKVKATEGRPFTLREINRLLRPRLKIDTLRFHVENLVNNLYVEKLPRDNRREPQLYVYRDVLKTIEEESPLNGAAHSFLTDLYAMVFQMRLGAVIKQEELIKIREQIRNLAVELQQEVDDLLKLHDCVDLWTPNTLTERLGFTDEGMDQ